MAERTALLIGPFCTGQDLNRWESFDLVVAVDAGLDPAYASKVPVDLAVGDFDSASASVLGHLADQGRAVEVIRVSSNKDYSDLDLALRECLRRLVSEVVLVGFLGGRLDHQLAVLGVGARYAERMSIRLSDPVQTIEFITAGRALSLSNDALFSVFAWGTRGAPTATVSISGARWPLSQAILEPLSDFGLSNIAGPDCIVEVSAGLAIVVAHTEKSPASGG